MSVKETTGTENSIMIQICQLLINYSINLKKTKLIKLAYSRNYSSTYIAINIHNQGSETKINKLKTKLAYISNY
jgi:hypothetical protein